jgi:restriction endonuclease
MPSHRGLALARRDDVEQLLVRLVHLVEQPLELAVLAVEPGADSVGRSRHDSWVELRRLRSCGRRSNPPVPFPLAHLQFPDIHGQLVILIPPVPGDHQVHHASEEGARVAITTGSFTSDARAYVDHIEPKVVLVDGRRLAELMMDFDLGVNTVATYKLKRVDSDYFDDSSAV